MKKENKRRIIIWSIICFITLSLGITGLLISGDVKFSNWFSKNNNKNEVYIDLSRITLELTLFLENHYLETETTVTVKESDNNISIALKDSTNELNYLFTLNNEVLSFNYNNAEEKTIGTMIFNKVVSFIQNEYFGINEEETLTMLDNGLLNYTIENNGIESTELNGIIYNKLDVSKQITLIIESSNSIEISDLETSKDYLINNGTYQTSKGNIILYKTSNDTETKVSIMEKNFLTNDSYNSIISVITVMFNIEEAELFKSKYASISNNSFDNYVIEVNPELSEIEKNIIGNENYKLIRITITK